jgi:hypothetical protein
VVRPHDVGWLAGVCGEKARAAFAARVDVG